MDTAPRLNFQVFSTALVMLSGRFAKHPDAENQQDTYRRIIFQSLAIEKNTMTDEPVTQTEEDDQDLKATLAYLADKRWKRPNPCHTPYRAPPLPPASSFPSSFSRRLDGSIRFKTIEVLLRSLMILRLRRQDLQIENTPEHSQGLRKATESILATIQGHFKSQVESDFNWEHFDYLFKQVAPHAVEYFPCLLELFLAPPATSSPKNTMGSGVFSPDYCDRGYPSASQQLKYSNITTFIPALHNQSSLLTSPRLAQILFALDTLDAWSQYQLQNASLLTGELGAILEGIDKLKLIGRHEMLILVSGSRLFSADESPQGACDFVCGAFLRQTRGSADSHITTTELPESIIFALEPLQCSSEVGRGSMDRTGAEGTVNWAIRVETGAGVVSTLSLDAVGTVTRGSLGCGNHRKVEFLIQRIELLVLGTWPTT
ncbi:hypothetical protein BT63DRAFT_296031 [Microthyrium microscopicum]|uniref:Uncharacterized protein n=1 Tax=Microthyrium microscopicum TaxID=703497 RepID=A0A6A6U5Q4_9PEZI|nr:hypothetical protein BT63DRAFT_296031 [Microthyrium microscopicum]